MREVYRYNPRTKEVELVGRFRGGLPPRVYFPKDSIHSGARFEHLRNKPFSSAKEKREYMKRKNIAEAG